jgi:hypothetical protein
VRTPDGRPCDLYYEDFARDVLQRQECRAARAPRSAEWRPDVCAHCAVPDILLANGSPDLRLTIDIRRRMLLGVKVTVTARCARHDIVIPDPYVGCPRDLEDLPPFE